MTKERWKANILDHQCYYPHSQLPINITICSIIAIIYYIANFIKLYMYYYICNITIDFNITKIFNTMSCNILQFEKKNRKIYLERSLTLSIN